uniref:Uncharacterized protein n=1 Tax=Anguilla anguilla TaxID=7936 RepID=A0A0E9UAE6_ANGAN
MTSTHRIIHPQHIFHYAETYTTRDIQ